MSQLQPHILMRRVLCQTINLNSAFSGLPVRLILNIEMKLLVWANSIEKIAKIQKYSYENELNNNDNSTFYVTVTYHLKNNKTVIRNYDNTNSNVMLQILDLTDSKEYKDELEFLMSSKRANETSSGNYTEKGAYNEYYFSNFSSEENAKATLTNGEAYIVANDAFTKTQIENTPELRDAILKDIEEIGYKKQLEIPRL